MGAQTCPIVSCRRGDELRSCGDRGRLRRFRSKDLENWGNRELMNVKGPYVEEADLGKLIYVPFLHDRACPAHGGASGNETEPVTVPGPWT